MPRGGIRRHVHDDRAQRYDSRADLGELLGADVTGWSRRGRARAHPPVARPRSVGELASLLTTQPRNDDLVGLHNDRTTRKPSIINDLRLTWAASVVGGGITLRVRCTRRCRHSGSSLGQPVLRSPAAMPLMVSSSARSVSADGSWALARPSSETCSACSGAR